MQIWYYQQKKGISKRKKNQVLYQEIGNSIPIIWALQEQHLWGKRDTDR